MNGSGNPVAKGTKIRNSLYKMDLVERWTEIQSATSNLSFATTQEKPSWETWHRHFGHVSYDGLRKLLRGNFVDGLNVDEDSPQLECVTCVESKMAEEPYRGLPERQMNPGALTHIDVWGKYDVTSINGHQYYLPFVDDTTRYITVNFLKRKDEASARVKDYIVHLQTHDKIPQAIRMDQGTEFVNEVLKTWCREQGIDIQLTAPYSPSQNGVAERMNRTLVELARAMLRGQHLPEFLWEHAVERAAYLRNRVHSRDRHHIRHGLEISQMSMPFENSARPYGSFFKDRKSHVR